ncbi:MAG: trimethylamine methyltransferase family protein [Anaerolineales bacterium]|jgi:trimethylamine--corrinoid protein Co-methyltransferase
MTAEGYLRNFSPLKILSEEQVEAIHRGSLEILESTGIRFESEKALEYLSKKGCKVDFSQHRVRFPSGLVEECVCQAPSCFRLKGRTPDKDVNLGGNTLYFSPSPGMRTVDLDTWEQRVPTLEENHAAVRVLDALENIHLACSYTPYCEIENVSPNMVLPVSAYSRMKYFTKPQRVGTILNSHIWEIHMAEVVGIDVFGAMEAAPPLTWYKDAIDCAWACAEQGYPVEVGCGCVMGGTGPATQAGALVQSNAEILSGIVLVELIRPGTGILANSFVFAQNMRSGLPVAGGIEVSLFQVAFNQIWRGKYNLPTMLGACGPSNSKRIDIQLGYEKGVSSTLAAISGASVINLHGGISVELTYHPVQSILDNDLAGMLGKLVKGITVTPETLALDLIQVVGPMPGHYLNTKHTRDWWKKEQYLPQVMDRTGYPDWLAGGKKSALDLARAKMEKILATHHPEQELSQEQERELDRILNEASAYYKELEGK